MRSTSRRNPYSHRSGIRIHNFPERLFTCPGIRTGLLAPSAIGCLTTKSMDTFRPGGFPFMATGYIESPEEPWQMHVRALEVATGKLVWDYLRS